MLRRGSGDLLLNRRRRLGSPGGLAMMGGLRAIGGGVGVDDGLGRGGFPRLVGEIRRGGSYGVSIEG
jgi:hypothetical protein